MKPVTFTILVRGVGFENSLEVLEILWETEGSELLRSTQCFRFLVRVVEPNGDWVMNVVGLQFYE